MFLFGFNYIFIYFDTSEHLLRPDTTNWEDQFFDASSAAPTDTSDSTPTSNSNSNEVEDERQNRAGKIKWEPNSRVVNYASRSLTKVPIVKIADLGTACWTRKHFTGIHLHPSFAYSHFQSSHYSHFNFNDFLTPP